MARQTFVIPAGSKGVPCDGHKTPGGMCTSTIYFAPHPRGGQHPFDCDPAYGGQVPTENDDGVGVSHFGTCKDAQKFAKRRKR